MRQDVERLVAEIRALVPDGDRIIAEVRARAKVEPRSFEDGLRAVRSRLLRGDIPFAPGKADAAGTQEPEIDEASQQIDLLATALEKIEERGCLRTNASAPGPDFICPVDGNAQCSGCIAHEALVLFRGE